MRLILLLLLLLMVTMCMNAQSGKVWFNQSVKATFDTASNVCWIKITNKNDCTSILEIEYKDMTRETSQPLPRTGTYSFLMVVPFEIRVRNATYCYGGSTDWLTIDSRIRATDIKLGTVKIIQPGKQLNCDKETTSPPVTHGDSTVATRVR